MRLNRLHADDAVFQRANLATWMQASLLDFPRPAYFADVKAVDEKDRHVAASALQLRHDVGQPVGLLTWNLKDFPRPALLKLQIIRYNLDELLLENEAAQLHIEHVLKRSVDLMSAHVQARPLAFPTAFSRLARPLPVQWPDWIEFLARNKLYRNAKLLKKQFKDKT